MLSSEIKSRKGFFFKSFEKFYVSVVDHIYDFLNKGNNEEMNDTFYCENCKMTINCAKRYNFLKLPEVLALGFDFDSSADALPLKVEQKINLSFFVSEDDIEREDVAFTKYLSTINDDVGLDSAKAKKFETDVYSLKGLIQLRQEDNGFSFIHYINIKNNWLKIENGKQKRLNKPPSIISSPEEPVVFVYYEKERRPMELRETIQQKLKGKADADIQRLSIPDEFLYKLLYLGRVGKPTLDFSFCSHGQLKPLYKDIYGCRRQPVDCNAVVSFPFIEHKKFNKELSEYKEIFKRQNGRFETPGNRNYIKVFGESKIGHSHTIEFAGVKNEDGETVDCSFARLNYLANAVTLPRPIALELLEEFNYSNKELINLEKRFYSQKCQTCTIQNKKTIINRILQKALVVNFLASDEPKNFLIDICWFKNFKLFLLADISQDNLAKHLFNYEYVTEKFNINMLFYYTQFKHNYGNVKEMLKNEFVVINNSLFWFLKEIYNCEDIIVLNESELEFLENKEFLNTSSHCLSSIEFLIYSLLCKFLKSKGDVVLDEEGKEKQFDYKNFKMEEIDLLTPNDVETLLLDIYDDLLLLNKQMNVFIKTKIKTDFDVFDNNDEESDELNYWKNLKKVNKMFGTNNLDAIDFNPCRVIIDTIADKVQKSIMATIKSSSYEGYASIDKLIQKNTIKESNVIKQMDSKTVNELMNSIENKKKRIVKTRTYLENVEFSHKKMTHDTNAETKKSKKSIEFEENFESLKEDSLFSKNSSVYSGRREVNTKKAKDSRFKQMENMVSYSPQSDSVQNEIDIDYNSDTKLNDFIGIESKESGGSFKLTKVGSSFEQQLDIISRDDKPRLSLPKKSNIIKDNIKKVMRNSIDRVRKSGYSLVEKSCFGGEEPRLSLPKKSNIVKDNIKKVVRNSMDMVKKSGYCLEEKNSFVVDERCKLIINKTDKKKEELITFDEIKE